MPDKPREATADEVRWVLGALPEAMDPEVVSVHALTREDGAAWFWVYPRDVEIGDVYVTWVVERTVAGAASVGSFRSRRSERGDVTVP
ncbi:MAG: hypothetical protein ABMB14_26230 [Myxococcota bacterium]